MLRRSIGDRPLSGVLEMHSQHGENQRYIQHLSMLSALTPSHLTRAELNAQLQELNTAVIPGTVTPTRCFNNVALFNTDCYRAEILTNVDNILEKYQGDFTTPHSAQPAKIEKDLLWASLQLFAHLQAIEQEIGLQLEPKTDYLKSLEKLEACQAILTKNGSNIASLTELLHHKPIISNVDSDKWYEKTFKDFIQYIDDRNNTRLFWVWGRPNLDLVLEYAGQTDARTLLAETTYWPGQISWSLYIFRGSFFALKLFNVWWNNPKWLKELEGLTAAERAEYRTRYLVAYWDVYKYRILNDYVWGPINLVCLEWWTGVGIYEWLGNFATCFLLCMDIYLADLAFKEEEEKYLENKRQYDVRSDELTNSIIQNIENGVQKDLLRRYPDFEFPESSEKIRLLHKHLVNKTQNSLVLTAEERVLADWLLDLNEVQQGQQDSEQRWQKKKTFLWMDCIYTKALLVAFAMCASLLIGGFLPLALSVFLAKSGTMLCLALTIVYRTVRAQMQIAQAKEERTALQAQEEAFFKEFNYLKVQAFQAPQINHDKEMHDLHLHLVNIGAQIEYQSASIQYQYLELARATLMRALIPTLIGLTLVYAPATVCMVPSYVFVLVASAALAYALDKLAKTCKPEEVKTTSILDHTQYQNFFRAPKVYSKHVEGNFFSIPSRLFA